MPSPLERTRNNVRTGIFVTVAIVLAVGTIIVLTDIWRTLRSPTREYTATFEVSEGVKNLKQGGEVRVGGVLLGKVAAVTPRLEGDEALQEIDVTFNLDRRVTLFADASVLITPALIGGDARLDIYSVGTPAAGAPVDDRLDGYSGPGVMVTLLGPGNADKADQIVEDTAKFVADMKATGGDVRALASTIRNEDWPRWEGKVNGVLDWAAAAPDRFDQILDEGRGLLTDGREVIAENRPSIRNIVTNAETSSENVQAVTERVRNETVDKVHAVLATGREGLDQATAVLEDLHREFDIWSTDIGEALASARLTGQQLKLASIEVRRSPWKLLYRPSPSEVDHELLYAAARSFALAASDLKATTASIRRLLDRHREEVSEDPRTLELLNEYLGPSLERYAQAQQRLLDVLLTE
ncbi:MAG: MlaD family protein [Planctomycetota bacterium]|jgi:ABC-type transporter Mla subunit MlaD